MKNRVKKQFLYSRLKWTTLLSRLFVKDTLRSVIEAKAGKVKPYFVDGKG